MYEQKSSWVKWRAISRFALSGESEAWITFLPISSAKSPRIVPGAASAGFVAPTSARTTVTADFPYQTIRNTGPLVI